MNERFTEEDLAPSDDEARAVRASRIDRAAAAVASAAIGLTVGGRVALGACAAPFVFSMTPAPFSGTAMGSAFARFDRIAIAAGVVLLGAEVVRAFLARRRRPKVVERVRRLGSIAFACIASVMGLWITPEINTLHEGGARMGEGDQGQKLQAIHTRASGLGKLEAALGLLLIGAHVFTARSAYDELEDAEAAPGPAAPGGR